MVKLAYLATVPDVLFSFMKTHILVASKSMETTLISHPKRSELLSDLPAKFIRLDVERKISFISDFFSLLNLVRIFRENKFDIVHTIMPKTGLLGMFAAFIVGTPCRIHTFTGQVWVTKIGYKRWILKFFDKLIVLFSTQIIVDSPSQRDFLISEGVVNANKVIVIGNGSISGVDHNRFKPNPLLRESVRKELGVTEDQALILYLGRLTKDKGVIDLIHVFKDLIVQGQNVVLALVGSEEDVPFKRIQQIAGSASSSLRRVDFTANPEKYMAAADIFCLPSYREGFGQVILEAASSGVPSVATKIYGVIDAVEDGKSGLLFTPADRTELMKCLLVFLGDKELRVKMGQYARIRAIRDFSANEISEKLCQVYKAALAR
jgi:glycosyltransferase involved in cell wall biosynthesis